MHGKLLVVSEMDDNSIKGVICNYDWGNGSFSPFIRSLINNYWPNDIKRLINSGENNLNFRDGMLFVEPVYKGKQAITFSSFDIITYNYIRSKEYTIGLIWNGKEWVATWATTYQLVPLLDCGWWRT